MDDTSCFLSLIKLCSENLLNIEQLDSSLGRNIERKMLVPLEENLENCGNDPYEFMGLVAEILHVWGSYFRLSRHSFRDISGDLLASRSIQASSFVRSLFTLIWTIDLFIYI